MKKIVLSTLIGILSVSALNTRDCIMVKELNVQFKNASTTYSDSSEYNEIKEYAQFLKDTDLYALIEGHTSSLSNATYNYDLSTRRSAKVRETLVSLGVNPSHVKSMGFGESSPLYDNNTEEDASKNRRVRREIFNSAEELNSYISSESKRISSIKYQEQ